MNLVTALTVGTTSFKQPFRLLLEVGGYKTRRHWLLLFFMRPYGVG